jgi:hypothetical protein
MCRFCNGFLQNLETCTFCWMCTTFLKSWNWLMHTMKPPSRSRPPPPLVALNNHHILLQGLKWYTQLHPSYIFATIVAIMPTKVVSATFLLRVSFVIIVGKRDIRNMFVLPSSWNGTNFNYHNKIC